MMAAYPPHPGGMQPGMPHSMPGMPPGGGQPMGHPMQMGGVSGGNPHMAQTAAMMNMQGAGGMPGGMGGQGPGGGMGMPGQNFASMMQQQQHHQQQMQQQMQQNPQLMAQQRQAYLRQQQLMQQQQQQMGGMAMGANPQQMGMNPQQLAQMQNNPAFHGSGSLPPHQVMQLQQMQQLHRQQAAQQQAQQQAQQAQQQAQAQAQQQAQQQQAQQQQQQQPQPQPQQTPQMAQQQPPQQAGQPQGQGPNQQQNMAHHVAMQHAPSQQSNHSAPGPGQAQTPHSGQNRAQSQVPGGADGSQAGQTPQPGPQNPPTTQPGQQGQQGNAQAQAMTPQQQQMMQQRQQQMLAANMLRQQQQQQQQTQQNRNNSGTFILKLLSFTDHLGSFTCIPPGKPNNLEYWQQFVTKFFSPEGKFVLQTSGSTEGRIKQFTTPYSMLPRFWWTHFESGVQNLQVRMEGSKQSQLPNEYHYVSFERCQFIFWYKNGIPVIWTGKMNAVFPPNSDKLELMEFELNKFEEYLPRQEVHRIISMGSPTMTRSPKMSKNTPKQRQMSKIKGMDAVTMDDFPSAPLKEHGLPSQVVQFLEIGETMFMMQDLIEHAQRTELRPTSALASLVSAFDESAAQNPEQNNGNNQPTSMPTPQQQQMMLQQQRQASIGSSVPPNRTPMQANMQLGQPPNFSPQVSNMNMPMGMSHLNGPMTGSPHIAHPQNPQLNMLQQQQMQAGMMAGMQGMVGSPAPMAAPMMLPQHSQQGTNSSAASANTSPNVTAKRRRSTVKMEDEGGGEVNGQNRVKASPRVGGNKKLKG